MSSSETIAWIELKKDPYLPLKITTEIYWDIILKYLLESILAQCLIVADNYKYKSFSYLIQFVFKFASSIDMVLRPEKWMFIRRR